MEREAKDRRRWAGELYLAPGSVTYTGPGGRAETHRHLAVQVIRSFDEPFRVALEESEFEARVALVPSGVPHSFEAGSQIALALVEPSGEVGRSLQEFAKENPGIDLADRVQGDWEPGDSVARLLSGLDLPGAKGDASSPVVREAVAFVEENLEGRPTLAEAARESNISESRLTHLFTAEVGIPFRRYVLWARMRSVVELIERGSNLTEAAIESGFSDSSHLSRVFRENFGMAPSVLLGMELSGGW